MPGPWLLLGLLLTACALLWAARRVAVRLRGTELPPERSLRAIAAALAWIFILVGAGLLTWRYAERLPQPGLGFGASAFLLFGLSLAHAELRRRLRAAGTEGVARRRSRRACGLFVGAVLIILLLGSVPIVASDLFRMPYSRVWTTINRTLDRLHYTYNPPGGGEAPSFPPWRTPGDAGLAYSDVTLKTSDGLRLAAWFVPASDEGAATVLLAHGLQDSKWTLLRLIPWLHEAGYNVLSLDFRGHGASDRRPTTLGPEEALDVQAALDWLESEGVEGDVVGLGQSLGAAALVNAAVEDGRLKALVLDSLFSEWENVDYARGYRLPPEWLVPGVLDPVDLCRQIEAPVLIIHGTADILVHVDHAVRLYLAANEPKELWVNDSGHAWSAWTYPELYKVRVLSFLHDALVARDAKKG